MLGRSHCFLGITSTLGGDYVLLKDTSRQPEWGSNPRPLDPESDVLTTRPPRRPTPIQKREGGPDRSVRNHHFSSVTLNELAMKVRESILLFRVCLNEVVIPMTDINPNDFIQRCFPKI